MAAFISPDDLELRFIKTGSFLVNSWPFKFLNEDVKSAADSVAGVQLFCVVSASVSSSTLLKLNYLLFFYKLNKKDGNLKIILHL